MTRIFYEQWDMLLPEMIEMAELPVLDVSTIYVDKKLIVILL